MTLQAPLWGCLLVLPLLGTCVADAGLAVEVRADPAALCLRAIGASYALLVQEKTDDGRLVDLTSNATYRSLDPRVAWVTAKGRVQAVADGSTIVLVEAAGRTLKVPVRVEGAGRPRRYNFENDII